MRQRQERSSVLQLCIQDLQQFTRVLLCLLRARQGTISLKSSLRSAEEGTHLNQRREPRKLDLALAHLLDGTEVSSTREAHD